jgi:hypothetical protein
MVNSTCTYGGYRILTALNHRGNRNKNNYRGPDLFLTNDSGRLTMKPQNSTRGQLWNFTGEGRLQNFAEDDLFLTANGDKSLGFKKRDPNDPGQIWHSDWHPTSKLFKNYAINIYGGRNVDGATVGLYPKSGSANEEWRRASDDSYLGKPKCIYIECHPDKATIEHLDTEAKENGYASRWVERNESGQLVTLNYEKDVSISKETSSSNTQNVEIEASYKETVEAGISVEGVASVKASAEYSFSTKLGTSFTQGKKTVSTETEKWAKIVPVPKNTGVEIFIVGKKVKFRIPYTMKFDDGSELEDFLVHDQSYDVQSTTREFPLEK